MKKQTEHLICIVIRQQLKKLKISKPVTMHYTWIEPNRKRDKDNIAFAKKFIQDALVDCEVLKDDGWTNVIGFTDTFGVDKKNPRVVVTIEEREEAAIDTKHRQKV